MSFYAIIKKIINSLQKLFPIISFAIPFIILYSLNPESYEFTWKGRAYYIIFIWLTTMEVILNWKSKINVKKLKTIRAFTLFIALLLPIAYVIYANYYGLNNIILDLAKNNNIYVWDQMPLSIEYLVFSALFGLIVFIMFGPIGLSDYSIPMLLLGIMGALYTIDNFYPYGRFTPLQIFVPITTTLAASFLNLLGYQTRFTGFFENTPVLQAWNSFGGATFGIAWPCAGAEGLIIYTVTILLFLKKSEISFKRRFLYFIVGAFVTYFINILRIVTIFTIAASQGDWLRFHNYYGQLFTVTWIASYMLIIAATQNIWKNKIQIHTKMSQIPRLE